jgi:thymidylate synthase
MNLISVNIEATDLPDAWFQTIYKIIEVGKEFKIDRGSFAGDSRLELDWYTCHIRQPGFPKDRTSYDQLTPKIPAHYNIPNPVEPGYVESYLPYLITGELKPMESYTYGSRICRHPFDPKLLHVTRFFTPEFKTDILIKEFDELIDLKIIFQDNFVWYINQMALAIWTYKNKGHRNNQMIIQVGQPEDMVLQDPACLRSIDTRIQDGKLHFYLYFRSWDVWSGSPSNLAGLQIMKEYMAEEIGVEDGEIIAASKGAHIYKYTKELAERIRGKTMDEFRNDMKC